MEKLTMPVSGGEQRMISETTINTINVSGNNKRNIFSSKSRVAALALLFALLLGWALAYDVTQGRVA